MPKGITGTSCAAARATAAATSSLLSQNTTASGGGTSKGDSSRPCCSRTTCAVLQRLPKRACRAASSAAGMGRGTMACSGKGAFISVSTAGAAVWNSRRASERYVPPRPTRLRHSQTVASVMAITANEITVVTVPSA